MTDDIAMENARLFEIEGVSGNIAQTAIVLRRMVLDTRVELLDGRAPSKANAFVNDENRNENSKFPELPC